ncbi:MAG: DUF1203 domain-containing protein [Paracoccaceae bacterium]
MQIKFVGLPSETVAQIKRRDTYGHEPDREVSGGDGYPCRHCLQETPHGEDYLILAHRPFEGLNAYTETGPIFLCAQDCGPYTPSSEMPPILKAPQFLVRGYTADERIRYGTGKVVETAQIPDYAAGLLSNPDIAFVDVRSASNNCYQCRIVRA